MDEQQNDPGPTRTAPAPRRFRRSSTDRMVAGVAGGLAEAFAVDPVVIRVLLGVLTFFGGAGVIIYGVCWLLMPDDDREVSFAEKALRRDGSSNKPALALAAILGVATLATMDALFDDHRSGALIALVVVAAVFLARRQDQPGTPWAARPPAPAAPAPWQGGWERSPWETGAEPQPARTPLPPLAPPAPRERSILGRVTLGLILVALGLLAAADLSWADVPAAGYPAVVLGGAGLGLLVGARYGRARSLIALGLLAAVALPVAAFAESFDGDVSNRDRTIVPADAAGIASEYSYRVGGIRLDLSHVDFAAQDVSTKLRLGAGDLQVTVPPTTDVHLHLDLGAGDATFFGSHSSGLGVSKQRADNGPDGPGGGTLDLTVTQGFGRVEVLRATS